MKYQTRSGMLCAAAVCLMAHGPSTLADDLSNVVVQFDSLGTPTAGGVVAGPITGACCIAGGLCIPVESTICTAVNGDYLGDGTACDMPDLCTVTAESCEYLLDNSSPSVSLGNAGLEQVIVWANNFEANGCNDISVVRVFSDRFVNVPGVLDSANPVTETCFGETSETGISRTYRAYIYDDPNNNFNPAEADLLSSGQVTVTTLDPYRWIDIPVQEVTVNGRYWVAMSTEHCAGEFPANADGSGFDPKATSISYFGAAELPAKDVDRDNPLPAADIALAPLTDITDAVFMLRALGNPMGNMPNTCETAEVVGATGEIGFSGGAEHWFAYSVTSTFEFAVAPGTNPYGGYRGIPLMISASGSFLSIDVFDGADGCPGTLLGSGDDSNPVVINDATQGDRYLIRVLTPSPGESGLSLEIEPLITYQANDLCTDAETVNPVPGGTIGVVGSSVFSTFDSEYLEAGALCGDGPSPASLTSPGVWYKVIGTGNTLNLSLCNVATDFSNTKLSVFCNNDAGCGFLVCATGNNDDQTPCVDGGPDPTTLSSVEFCSESGTEYFVLVHGFGQTIGTFTMDVADDGSACNTAPNCNVDNSNCLFPERIEPGETLMGFDLCTASPDLGIPDCGFDAFSAGMWFECFGDGTEFTASLCFQTSFDSNLSVFRGGCSTLECVTLDNPDNCFPNESLTWCTNFGERYLVRVHAATPAGCGMFSLTLNSGAVCQAYGGCNSTANSPDNDCCDGGTLGGPSGPTVVDISRGSVSLAFDNTYAETDGPDGPVFGEPDKKGNATFITNPCGSAGDDSQVWNDLFYLVTAPETGPLTVSICGSDDDPPVSVPTFQITGDQAVPPTGSSGTGVGTFDLSDNGDGSWELSWDISYQGLTGTVTLAHFHLGAFGETGGVEVNIGAISGLDSPMIGTTTITDMQAADLQAGLWYVNIHTTTSPGGEIRGQAWEDAQNPPDLQFDSKMAAYLVPGTLDCSPPSLLANFITCNEDCGAAPPDVASEITFDAMSGETFLIRLGSFDSDNGAKVDPDGPDGERGRGTITFSMGDTGTCVGDADGDNVVSVTDLTAVILDWATDGSANNGDINGSGFVDVGDLTAVILAWGPCP